MRPISIADLDELNAFDGARRGRALERLAAAAAPPPAARPRVNLHLHSFFSFNTLGYSPSRLAWETRQAGLYAAGLCDFDVLDGLEEFLRAGLVLELRAAVHLETRAYVGEYAGVDINSPGEPGVAYLMGAGFPRLPPAGSPAAAALAEFGRRADARNRGLAARINARLPDIAVDYAADVSRLSPGNCPTERHLVRAYRLKAEARFPSPAERHAFWARVMNKTPDAAAALAAAEPALEDAIRSALVKRGGIGYAPPTPASFPPADDFCAWVLECGAMPMIAWLDGASAGERDPGALFECLLAKGACALNIIPDRNHNVADPAARAAKLARLAETVALAEALALPVNIGTEMNKEGQPFADDLDGEALRPYRDTFLRGARIMVGQALLARYADFAYAGAAAGAEFGADRSGKNRLFESVGGLPPLARRRADLLEDLGPGRALAFLRDAAKAGRWPD